MIKELILAIVLGCLLGFGVTGFYIAVNKNKVSSNRIATISPVPTAVSNSTNTQTTPEPTPTIDTGKHQLAISSPENESITTTSTVTVKGTTTANSSIVITTASKSYLTNADSSGLFTVDIETETGVNQIQVNSFDSQDNQASSSLLVTYSTAKF